MKFIIPQNYDLKTKIFGIIDSQALILDSIWSVIVFVILKIFVRKLSIKIFVFIISVFPVVIFSLVGVNGEDLLYFLNYIIKYLFSNKIFLYDKAKE